MSKQTAVQWLIEQLDLKKSMYLTTHKIIDQAIQMEREQIIQAHGNKMRQDIEHGIDVYRVTTGQQYYNETYGNKDE